MLGETGKKRIAFLATNGLINTGGNIYDMKIMEGLSSDHNVELHTSGFEEVDIKRTGLLKVPSGIDVSFHRKPFQFYPKNIILLTMARLYRGGKTIWDMALSLNGKGKFDYVVFCEDLASSVFPIVSRNGLKNIAIIHHIGDENFRQYLKNVLRGQNPFAFWMRKAGCHFLRKMDLVITVSNYWKEKLQREYGCKDVEVIPNGLDTNFFNDHSDIKTFKRKYGLEGKFILMTGVLGRGRGIETALSAVDEMDDVKFLVTGRRWSDPMWEDKVEPMMKRLEAEGKFIWTEVLPWNDYKTAILSSDAVALLSEYEEGWGRILHEGALAGKPLITTGLGGMKEITQGTSSWIIKPGDVEGLKKAIEDVRGLSSEDLSTIKEMNHGWAEDYTWEKTTEGWKKLIAA